MERPRFTAKLRFTFWQDGSFWLGFLDDYPDYLTQGTTLDDLKEHLLDILHEIQAGNLPGLRQHGELEVPA